MTDKRINDAAFLAANVMDPYLPIEISMSVREWSLIVMALRSKEHDIEDAIEGMPSEAAAAQLVRYAATYAHIRKALLEIIMQAEEDHIDRIAQEDADMAEWREDQ